MARRALDQELAAALLAEHGSQRAAASAAGIPRSTFHDIYHGRFEGRVTERTAGLVEQAVTAVTQVIGGFLRSLGGGDPNATRRAASQQARAQRRSPGIVQERAQRFQAETARVGVDGDGRTLRPASESDTDTMGRAIKPTQREAYEELLAEYAAGGLSIERYERFVGYQLDPSTTPTIEPLTSEPPSSG